MNQKLLIISNVSGGLVNFRLELMQRLSKQYDVTVLAEENAGRAAIEESGCTFINIPIERHGKNPIKEYGLYSAYYRIIKSIKPLAVLTYTIKPNIYAGSACARLGIPYIANITGLGDAIENKGILSWVARLLYRHGLRKAAKVFFQNKANCDFFRRNNILKTSYDILPGSGVNLEKHLCEPYPNQDEHIILSVVGRITKDKGIDEILSAADSLSDENIIIRLIGSCEDDYLSKIRSAEAKGVIEYVGRKENIHEWYKESHAILHASYHEGMSNVLLEAASCGRPILATNVPGCVETFDEGVTGFGFEPKSAEAIVKVVRQFIMLPHSKKAEMGVKGREKMEKTFNREIVIQKYLKTIEAIGGNEK